MGNQHGFTLIEFLVVITTTFLLVVGGISLYSNLTTSSQLTDSSDQVVQTVRLAQTRAQARQYNSQHGVYIQTNSIVLYQGDSYATRNSEYDRTTSFPTPVTATTTLLNDEVTFSRGLGIPNSTGTITLIHEAGGERIMTINDFGKIELE